MKTRNVCRCCLSETCFKDITNEYYHGGEKEVYTDILMDVFQINISQQHGRQLICEDCVEQLRSAAKFKSQVLHAEKVFLQQLEHDTDPNISTQECKDEFLDHITGEFDDDSDEGGDDCSWQNDNIDNEENGEVFVIKLETENDDTMENKMIPLETNGVNVDNENYEDIILDTDNVERSKIRNSAISDKPKLTKSKPAKSQTQVDMKQNSLKLINYSNLCLFDSLKTKFRCFYCKESFLNITELREHATTHSNPRYLKMCINRLQGMSFKNVDISALACKICGKDLGDLNDLRSHLIVDHKVEFTNEEHLLIPYRLENGFNCVICGLEFNTFYRLSIHMNSHYTNNVCEICGVSYINRISLRMHLHSMHKEKKCSVCPAVFQNNYSRVKHMRKVHNSSSSKRYCLLCNKTFPYTYLLTEHKIQEHGAKRQVSNCMECGKTFLTTQNLRIHIRAVHIRERNHACTFCGMRFFTKCDQRRHERTHQDVRSFACSYCEGRFKSKDSLRRHLKRQHGHLFITNHGQMQ